MTRSGTAVLVMLAALVAAAPAAAKPKAKPKEKAKAAKVSGKLFYEERDCFASPKRRYDPIAGARLRVSVPGGAEATTTLSSTGSFSLKVPGASKVHGDGLEGQIVFADDAVKIQPDAAVADLGDDPYSIAVALHKGANGKIILVQEGEAGVANVWSYMNRGARYLAKNSPQKVPSVTVRLKYGRGGEDRVDVGTSAYSSATHSIRIQDDPHRHNDHDDWEPFTILHEYGHHVLASLAPITTAQGGEHSPGVAYPAKPGLAYSEGFAHAFAATVLGKTDLGYECSSFLHIGKDRPDPRAAAKAQYDESPAGWVLLRLIRRFGFKPFVQSLIDYKNPKGDHAGTMREVRDAVALGAEKTAADDTFDNELFFDAGMAWGFALQASDDQAGDPESRHAQAANIEVWVEGPYGTCRSSPPPEPETPLPLGASWTGAAVPGALAFTYQDDCFDTYLRATAIADFPLVAGEAQETTPITVMARWACRPGEDPGPADWDSTAEPYDPKYFTCDDTRAAHIKLVMGNGPTNTSDGKGPATPEPSVLNPGLVNKETDTTVTSSGVPIATIRADGSCVLVGGIVCDD